MISIRKSVNELEQAAEMQKAAIDCYAMGIHSAAHYAVEISPGLATEFRQHLAALEEKVRKASEVDQIHAIQASFRGELRDFRDLSEARLKHLRHEVEGAAAAMQVFAETVASNSVNHEDAVKAEISYLEAAGRSENLDEIRTAIRASVDGIQTSIDKMRRDSQLVVAQLKDEIRLLHAQIELERRVLHTDRGSGAWNRRRMDDQIEKLLQQNEPFCLLLVAVRNLKRLSSQNSRNVIEGALKALVNRFAGIIGDEATIGRWTEEVFASLLAMPPQQAIALSTEVTRKLSGSYSVQENGLAQSVTLQVTAGVIDRAAGLDSARFHKKVEQLAAALSGA